MSFIFNEAVDFNQDLTKWCVTNITSEPNKFATNSALLDSNKPVWGYLSSLILSTLPKPIFRLIIFTASHR